MGRIEDLEKEIQNLRQMYRVCVSLLEFEKGADRQKNKLRELAREVIQDNNKNRIETIRKIINKAEDDTNISDSKRDDVIKNITGFTTGSQEIHKYIVELATYGPKRYMLECLGRIKECQLEMKQEREINKLREDNKQVVKEKPKEEKTTTKVISNSKDLTLKEIIKRHIRDHNPYIEEHEIYAIKKEFRIEFFTEKQGYLSDDTIEKLFLIRITNEQLDRHEEVKIKGIVDSMDAIYSLALSEMAYEKMNTKYERALDNINYVRNRDYVEEYAKLYVKVQEASYQFSKEERELFTKYIKSSKTMNARTTLPTPEEFRQNINETAKKRVDWSTASNRSSTNITDSIAKYTRYMTPKELAAYYHTLQSNLKDYDAAGLQNIFVNIIEKRMDPIRLDVSNEEITAEIKRRHKAISHEYLNEEPIMFDTSGVIVKDNYAESNIELREANKRSNIDKIYFREGKTKKTISFMNFKKLKEKAELKKLTEKEVLTDEEIEKVRGMF